MTRLYIVLSALFLVLAACGDTASTEVTATQAPGATDAPIETTATTEPAAEATLSDYLPFFSGPDDPEEAQAFYREQERQAQDSVATCMAEQGFEYIPFIYDGAYEDPFFDESLSEEERRAEQGFGMAYWLLNEEQFIIEDTQYEENPDPNWEIQEAMSDSEREAYYYALHGEQPDESLYADFDWENATEEEQMAFDEQMQRLWEDREWKGCFDLAYEKLYGGDDVWVAFEDEFGNWYEEVDARVQADPRIIEWQQEWTSCMTEAGFAFADQEDMWMTLDTEMQTIVDWGDEGGGFVEGPEITPILDEDGNPVENEDGSYTYTDDKGNIYTEQELNKLYDDLYGPSYDEAELREFMDREIEVALADWECGGDFWELQGDIYEEYQNEWVAENKEALDAWQAGREAGG